ncbi:3-oxoacyl-[acyl-carrier-protein] synthase III C-terminal domain-containing protein [Streptomyces sp. NPDC048269]|uniref:3-oxoacyl-[acyl-carrier-protein] synthase III C-terminal domain-containing protein n=1 Tax=Streptomyces sp. NPDC048269 TaxID=3155753 RepID=UPI003430748C
MTGTAVFLTGIAYELGEQEKSLADLTSFPPDVLEGLREVGVSDFRTTSRTSSQLAHASALRTLGTLGPGRRDAVTHVIHATNSHHDGAATHEVGSGRLLRALGLAKAFPLGVSLGYCANLHVALHLATALISAGAAGDVLVICADALGPDGDRSVSGGISVHCDAASSVLVTRDPLPGSLRLLHTELHIDPALADIDPSVNFLRHMSVFGKGCAHTTARALSAVGSLSQDISRVLPNNYNNRVNRGLAEITGFSVEQVFMANIPRLGHALASDNLINLADSLELNPAEPGERMLLLASGPNQWGVSVVEAR